MNREVSTGPHSIPGARCKDAGGWKTLKMGVVRSALSVKSKSVERGGEEMP